MSPGRRSEQHQYLIGLDLGTTAIKGVLTDVNGTVISHQKAAMEYTRAEEGQVQFDADLFYAKIAGIIHKLTALVSSNAEIKGISIASASGNTMLVDGAGRPILPAVSWMDKRVTDEMERVMGEQKESDVHRLIGWPLNKTFPLAQLSWLKCHMPAAIEHAERICMTTDYVNYRLTGCWGIDPSTATTSFLQDQVNGQWYSPYLRLLDIPKSKLPRIQASGTVLGGVTIEAARETGLLPGTPVVLGAFDHPCAARGSGVFEEGQMLISCGTSWVGFYPVRNRNIGIDQKLLIDPFLYPEGAWGVMFSLPAIAENIDQLICHYLTDSTDRYGEFDRLSAQAEPSAGGLYINPLEEKRMEDGNEYSKENIARSIMEGIVYLLKQKMDKLQDAGIIATSLTMVGGPSETHPWPQILCDILGMELSIINGSCAGAVGAAVLAGIGAGIYKNERDAFQKAAFRKSIRKPNQEFHERYQKSYNKFCGIYPIGYHLR